VKNSLPNIRWTIPPHKNKVENSTFLEEVEISTFHVKKGLFTSVQWTIPPFEDKVKKVHSIRRENPFR